MAGTQPAVGYSQPRHGCNSMGSFFFFFKGDCFQLKSDVYQEKSVICYITQITAGSGVYILEKVIDYW